jgi:hypothetical protein
MSTLRVSSSDSDAVVEFSEVDGDDFRVSVVAHDYSATRRVCAYTDRAGVARLFAEAARDWSGWRGAKIWESIDGDLRLELRTDRLGHATLTVRVRYDTGGSGSWRLETDVGLEAGQLHTIARDAERLWSVVDRNYPAPE